MKKTQKEQIRKALGTYIERMGSQNRAATSLNVSGATLSNIMAGKWEKISDAIWRQIDAGINTVSDGWNLAATKDYELLNRLFINAKQNAMVMAITGDAGTGKTAAVKDFASKYRNVYALHCSEYWNRKYFLSELMRRMGRESGGLTVAEMMDEVVAHIKRQEHPLVILDEADKLPDQVLHFFITLFNELEDRAGIILIATNYLRKRILRGVKLNRKGYKEIYSRIGRKFIELRGLGYADVLNICHANGITDAKRIKKVWETSEGDIRRVKMKIMAMKAMEQQTVNV